jgi:hypothetical protein
MSNIIIPIAIIISITVLAFSIYTIISTRNKYYNEYLRRKRHE